MKLEDGQSLFVCALWIVNGPRNPDGQTGYIRGWSDSLLRAVWIVNDGLHVNSSQTG